MTVKYITCDDCKVDWIGSCVLCKEKAILTKEIEVIKKKPWKYLVNSLLKPLKHPKRVTSLIYQGHEPICKCCGSNENLTFDHIQPISKGGIDCNTNGQILCYICNGLKADKGVSLKTLKLMYKYNFLREM